MSTRPGSTLEAMAVMSDGAPEAGLGEVGEMGLLGTWTRGGGEAAEGELDAADVAFHRPWPMPTPAPRSTSARTRRAIVRPADLGSAGAAARGGAQPWLVA